MSKNRKQILHNKEELIIDW